MSEREQGDRSKTKRNRPVRSVGRVWDVGDLAKSIRRAMIKEGSMQDTSKNPRESKRERFHECVVIWGTNSKRIRVSEVPKVIDEYFRPRLPR